MKLYLSSYMLGGHVARLHALAGRDRPRMAVITNALDHIPLAARMAYARNNIDLIEYFHQNGFDPDLLDLRYYFGRPDALRNFLGRRHIVWAVGGNSFLLRRAMRESGFDQIIRGLLEDGIIYSGWSAGACVAGDSLRAVGLMDQPDATAEGYEFCDPCWEGLGLVPYTVIPHFESQHPENLLAGKAARWATENGVAHMTLRDGDVLISDGDDLMLHGKSI